MQIGAFITSLPGWALFSLLVAAGVLIAEGGAWIAQRRVSKGIKEPEASIGTAVGAMLGLLAFMLGFTFSITAARYSDRKQLIIDHANAINTCYLYTSLIPEEQKLETRKLLQEYIASLLQFEGQPDVEKLISRQAAIHLLLWQQPVSLVQENIDSELRSLFTTSVNEVINLYNERKGVALIFQIPDVLWSSLFILFALSMFSIGYQTGTYSIRRILDLPLLAAAFALVIVMIADMDTIIGTRRFEISQQPLTEVYNMMQKDIP